MGVAEAVFGELGRQATRETEETTSPAGYRARPTGELVGLDVREDVPMPVIDRGSTQVWD